MANSVIIFNARVEVPIYNLSVSTQQNTQTALYLVTGWIAATGMACATSQSNTELSQNTSQRPMVASMETAPLPAMDPPQAVPEADGEDAASAGALLKRAFEYFKQDQNAMAAATFRAAIHTGNLNDAGRALAYWHIYVAEQSLGDTDRGVDALSSFVVVAQDVIEMREQMRYAEDESGDFVDRFDLKRRLARARAMLSVAWAAHANEFGRSAQKPVLVHSLAEKNYFLEMAPPCGHASKHPTAAPTIASSQGDVEQVNLTCDGGERTSYYFQVVQDD